MPRLEIRPRMVRPPVDICRGTRPSQAAKSHPLSKAAPLLVMSARVVPPGGVKPRVIFRLALPRATTLVVIPVVYYAYRYQRYEADGLLSPP